MNGHKAISARLSSFAGLTALVGTRIYPDEIPQPPILPAVVFHQIHSSTERGSTADPPLVTAVFQVSIYALSRNETRSIAVQVGLALDRWRKVTISGVTVDDCIFQGDVDLYEPETKTYFVSADYRLHFRE